MKPLTAEIQQQEHNLGRNREASHYQMCYMVYFWSSAGLAINFFPSTEKYWWQNWISNSTSLPFVLLKFLFWGNFKILWNRAKISISIFIPCDVLKIYIYEYAVSWCKNTVIFKEQDNRRQHSESDSPDPANCTLKVHDWKNAASIFCSHTRVWQFSTLYTHVKYFQH